MALNITPEHVAYKKKIGHKAGNPVWEILTTGGLYVDVLGKGAGFEIIATGPHRAVARYIAETRNPEIVWEEMSKSDFVTLPEIAYLLPEYEELTDRMRAVNGD
jgi:hypothetical protein